MLAQIPPELPFASEVRSMALTTPVDQLRGRAEAVKSGITGLGDHSHITDLMEKERQEREEARIWGEESTAFVMYAEPYVWDALPVEGQRLQQELHEEYDRFSEIVRVMLRKRVDRVQEALKEANRIIAQFVKHEVAGGAVVASEVKTACTAVDEMVSLVEEGKDASDRRAVFVPDTNALIYNSQIESWAFADFESFRIVITPTVLQELDQLKVTGRNEGLREKAEQVIRQLKEYQRRGALHAGVPIRSGKVELVAVAVEPEMSESLPWLRESNADDRLIATTFEVMRLFPHSIVVLVTRDINVQNKANFAGVSFVEPPEPTTPGRSA